MSTDVQYSIACKSEKMKLLNAAKQKNQKLNYDRVS